MLMGLPENPRPGGVRCLACHQRQRWEKQESKGTSKRHGRAQQGPDTSDPSLPVSPVALLAPGDLVVSMPVWMRAELPAA